MKPPSSLTFLGGDAMGGGHFTMSTEERDRLGVCVRIKAGELKLGEGSEQLRIGYRQMLRVYR